MSGTVITLTSDFGNGSPYVAQMKGVILSINACAIVVDLTHAVPPQDVRQGALVLDEATGRFPEGTIHVCVVDPGVGTDRRIVCAEIGSQRYIAPDNGLLSRLAARTPPARIVSVSNPRYWLSEVSSTFHGRDIMAPVAAHLSLGTRPEQLGEPVDRLTMLQWPAVRVQPGRVAGVVISIDAFGNLISNIDAQAIAGIGERASPVVHCGGRSVEGIVDTYGRRPPDALVALIGSSGKLEVALVGGSAAGRLGAKIGDAVTVTW